MFQDNTPSDQAQVLSENLTIHPLPAKSAVNSSCHVWDKREKA